LDLRLFASSASRHNDSRRQPQPNSRFARAESAKFITKENERDTLAVVEGVERSALGGKGRGLAARCAHRELRNGGEAQLSAPEVLDILASRRPRRNFYGIDEAITEDFGTRCLIARRLLERGVRFVQVWSGADNGFPRRNWDSHEDLAKDHLDMARSMDKPAAALIKDLKSRGMLDDTIVIWTTEFGRMPCSQGSKGRDHNPFAFTSWVAGGGFKGGVSYGESDEWSYKVAKDETYCYDLHATVHCTCSASITRSSRSGTMESTDD
jgi:hypothetical protein